MSNVTQFLLHYRVLCILATAASYLCKLDVELAPWTLGVRSEQKFSVTVELDRFPLLDLILWKFLFQCCWSPKRRGVLPRAQKIGPTGDVLIVIGARRDEVGFLMPGVGDSVVNCQSVSVANQMLLPNQWPTLKFSSGIIKFSGWPPISVCMWCTLNVRRYSNLREYWMRVPEKVQVSALHSSGEPRRKLEDVIVEIEPSLYISSYPCALYWMKY